MKNPLAKTKTVDTIVSAFAKVVADLDRVAEARHQEVKETQFQIVELENKQAFAQEEAEKAAAVKQKIQALIS